RRTEVKSADSDVIKRKFRRKSRESTSEHTRDTRSSVELKSNTARQSEQIARQNGRIRIEYAQEKISCAALSKIQINASMQDTIDYINSRVESSRIENPDIFKINLFEKIRRRF